MKLVLHRGNDFRPSFGRLGETRSLLPACTHYVAMTATADRKTKVDIIEKLHMKDPVYIEKSPNRTNIFYGVLKGGTEKVTTVLAAGLRKLKEGYPKTIIFCRK
jgi:ATP-dependent DNA helicase RecQ